MLVSMYMSGAVTTVGPTDDAHLAIERMASLGVRCLPVTDNDKLVGVVSRTDLLRAMPPHLAPFAAEVRACPELGFSVDEVMVRHVVTVAPTDSIDVAVALLQSHRLHMLVVVDEGRAVGVLSRSDILAAFREVVYSPKATRLTIAAEPGADVIGDLLQSGGGSGVQLRAYAEHEHEGRRLIYLALAGPQAAIESLLESAWSKHIRVLQVQRPEFAGST